MISAVVPAFNEEGSLAAGVRELLPVLEPAASGEVELVIVDDGSTDGTAREISALCADPRIRSIRLPRNRGKGAALKAGVAATRGDLVLVCDADMATPPAQLPRFLEAIAGGADRAIGSRRRAGAQILKAQPLRRVRLGRLHTWLANRLVRADISDYTCGFKLFRGDAARWIFSRCRSERWGYDVEILTIARRAGLRIREIPVAWRDGRKSGVVILPAMATTLVELARIWWRYRRGRSGPEPAPWSR
jgi:dolichyl-phosphate beta-glucosyltransferase